MFEKMNSLIFSILCIFVTEVRSKQALLFNLCTWTLEDAWHKNSSKKLFDQEYEYLAGCPASSPLEQKFNEDISLTKRSVFSRLIWRNQSVTGNDLDFCEKSYEPAMIFNPIEGEYKIGYELYFFGNETKIWEYNRRHYRYYKTVNTKKLPYKIDNRTIFNGTSDSEFVIRYVDNYVIMFNFTNGYPTLGFYWVDVLSIKCSKNNKHVVFDKYGVKLVNLIDKCGNYPLDDEDLYSKKNQKKCLKDILVPPSLLRGKPDLSCGHPYGCLTPSQILPLWYFTSRSARLASCSHINLIPVWKSIADGNLRAVDLFVATIIKKLVHNNREVLFGVYGVLEMMAPGGSRKMYLPDAKRDRVVEIPKIIYRIIKFEAWNIKSIAVIVIHNDPSAVQDADRLCDKDDTLSGWEKITNDDPKTGLTYVCPMTPKLEIKLSVNYNNIDGLHLAAVPREGYSGEVETDYKQKAVESIFERLKLKRYPYP
ncbi:uncharacterized protein LOC135842670 isoform X2 [Planococcus citri]|uniref:uncharacterized protein LOC135842670 isoform X2 n=1 Tax=Planococcus citri TaxID=170843 RepID=UPI0031F8E192